MCFLRTRPGIKAAPRVKTYVHLLLLRRAGQKLHSSTLLSKYRGAKVLSRQLLSDFRGALPSTLLSTYLLTQPRWRSTTCGGRVRLSIGSPCRFSLAGRGEALCARSSLRREDARRSRLRVGLLQDELPQVLASRAASPSPLAVPHPFQTPGGASTACRQTRGQENRIFGIVSIKSLYDLYGFKVLHSHF